MNKIYQIFKRYKWKLTLIYLFMLFTELSILTQPFLLGKSIDGLMIGTWNWIVLLGLSYFISAFFNYKQMIYDTKVYTQIYNDTVFNFTSDLSMSTSTKVARVDMVHDIVGVLEGYVHYYIATIVTIFGSIGFIYSENWRVGALVSTAFIFINLGVLYFYKKIKQSINLRNNHCENKVKSIETGGTSSTYFFNRRMKLDILSSTLQGKNWLLANIIKYIFLLMSIILLITTSTNITMGGVITIYSYINNFLISLMSIPVVFEMYARLSNILKRIV